MEQPRPAQEYEKTQFVPREERRLEDNGPGSRQGVLDHISLQDAHYRINDVERRISSMEVKMDAMAEKNVVTLALVQDVVNRQGRLEMALDTLAGFVKQNCGLVQEVIQERNEKSLKRQIVEACALMAIIVGCLFNIATAVKVY